MYVAVSPCPLMKSLKMAAPQFLWIDVTMFFKLCMLSDDVVCTIATVYYEVCAMKLGCLLHGVTRFPFHCFERGGVMAPPPPRRFGHLGGGGNGAIVKINFN